MAKRLMKEVVFMVTIGLRVLTRPFPDNLPTIYRSLGENYNERVLPSIIYETLKAVVAQYNASQLITQKEAVSREIRKLLIERAINFNIALDDVSITTLGFGKEFTHSIEAKQVAAQEAERAKFIVEQAEQDKKSCHPSSGMVTCVYTAENVAISGIHTHAGPGGYLQYVVYLVTSFGFVHQSFNVIVEGIEKSFIEAHENLRGRYM